MLQHLLNKTAHTHTHKLCVCVCVCGLRHCLHITQRGSVTAATSVTCLLTPNPPADNRQLTNQRPPWRAMINFYFARHSVTRRFPAVVSVCDLISCVSHLRHCESLVKCGFCVMFTAIILYHNIVSFLFSNTQQREISFQPSVFCVFSDLPQTSPAMINGWLQVVACRRDGSFESAPRYWLAE